VTIRVHSYVDGVCKSCGAVKNTDHIGPSWCSGRPTARAEANTLREQVERLTRERDEARANYAFMVERAADQRLDGYRELGARAAAAENERDEALESLEGLEAHIREHLPYTYDDGEDDDANPEECVEYAASEIRELKATNESLQQAFDQPDGGPMARAIARSSCHLEQHKRRQAEAERDEARAEVERLKSERDEANQWRERHSKDAAAYSEQSQKNWERAKEAERERDEARAQVERQKRDIRVLEASNDAKLEQWRRAERDLADAHALLRECHRELATIEAITVSPSDTDGLLNLVRRVGAALEAK